MNRGAVLAALLLSAAGAGAQSPLDRRITLHVRDIALRDALDRVAVLGDFRISYSAENLPLDRRVTVDLDTTAVSGVLAELLRSYAVAPVVMARDHVVLAPRLPEPGDSAMRPLTVLDRVVVTGSVGGATARALTVALDVVPGYDIERRNETALSAVFDGSVPGVWMWEQAPTSMIARYGSIRGASSFGVSFPKVYVDGVEMANPLLLTQLTPDLVERVEVIRGPQGAALYGADAISGVVNVISRRDAGAIDGARMLLRTQGGYSSSYGANVVPLQNHNFAARIGSNLNSAGLSLGGSTTGAYVPDAYMRELHAAGDARFVGTLSTITLTARGYGKNAGAPTSPLLIGLDTVSPDSLPRLRPASLRAYTVGANVNVATSTIWTYALTAGIDGYSMANVPNESAPIPASVDDSLHNSRGTAARASMRGSAVARLGAPEAASATLTFAAENSALRSGSLRTTLKPSSGPGPAQGKTVYVVDWSSNMGWTAQADLAWHGTAYLTAGVRRERVNQPLRFTQFATLPMLGGALVHDFAGVTAKVRAAYGKGIRAPEAVERIHAGDRPQLTNSDLRPEEQSGVEAGVDLLFDRYSVRLTRFDQLVSGLIQDVQYTIVDSSGTGGARRKTFYQLQNIGEISNTGWEAQASAVLGALTLTSAWSAVNSRVLTLSTIYGGDLQVGDRMLGVPARTATATASWSRRAVRVSSTVSRAFDWTNYDRLRIAECIINQCPDSAFSGPTLRNYWAHYDGNTRVRATTQLDLRSDLTLTFSGDNLLNQKRGEPDSFTIVPGRSVTAGVRIRF